MIALPIRFLALVTRTQLSEMLAQTYSVQKDIDPNEAYTRLESSLRNLKLIEGLQRSIWHALVEKKPEHAPAELVELLSKKLLKPKKFKGFKPRRQDDAAAMAALTVLMDFGASFSGGDAMSLLETPQGEKLLAQGFRLMGTHLAAEMLR